MMRVNNFWLIWCALLFYLHWQVVVKTAITSDDFKSKMESSGYIVQEATNQIADYNYTKHVYIAISSVYQKEFYELSDNDYAPSFFNSNKKTFEDSKTSVSVGNNEKYTLTTNGNFEVI